MKEIDIHNISLSPFETVFIVVGMIVLFSAIALLFNYLLHIKAKARNRFSIDSFLQKPTKNHQMIFCWALNSLLLREQNLSPFVLGGFIGKHTGGFRKKYQRNLREWWDIRSKEDVWEVVDALANCEMHSAAFQHEYGKLLTLSNDDFLATAEDKEFVKVFLSDRERLSIVSLDAWDQVRAIGVLGLAYNAGYVDKGDCYEPLLYIGRQIQSKYTSFSELGKHYYYGHIYWNRSVRKSKIVERNLKKLLNETTSPWTLFPYNYNLKEIGNMLD